MNETNGRWRIDNVNIVTGETLLTGSVLVEDGIIVSITETGAGRSGEEAFRTGNGDNGEELKVIDGEGGWLLPGFIDMHVHGGFGADFMDASRDAYDTITKFHASKGTTTMLATSMTAPKEAIEAVLAAADSYTSGSMPYARLGGVHLEGPFISKKWIGAQNPAFVVPPNVEWVKRWNEDHPGLIKQLTLAPETEGAAELIGWLAEQGIVAACGHTDATYEQIIAAADAGLRSAVHTYNAMTGLHHRNPGTLGAVMSDGRISAELIADGHHVHPAAMRILAAAKPADKLVLITDAMSSAGMGDGQYELGGQAVTVKDGVCRLTEGGSLAGSSLTMIDALTIFKQATGWTVPAISRLLSGNPAKLLGIDNRTGTIATGKWADLVWTDASFEIRTTWVEGRPVFTA
ncbi:N-acetylglucosamine-6-phosphate deacetylase [Paenibacillus beijingensis]|uniref:N-acetylglucosamine-6-phosphate deacetylase n=1 Tax=Paenibacillus beijingensis TaxID=1126833 RepID=A0A0D5NKX6_9BACL|nr:N-acetylglucosamine-6-phosphate deacetylase [Paenibacillus beijingensis]AJY76004.1 N-acetylglucosamine-6-phosphate deacetylase [Paenibacillus beijingensis]